jgi:putative protease
MPIKKKPKKKTIKKRTVKRKRPSVKRKITKKAAKKAFKRKVVKKKPPVAKKAEGNIIGKVTHYFPKVRAAVVKLKGPLSIGDSLKIKGHTTDFTQNVASIQIDRVPINTAKKGQEIGLLVNSRVRQHDVVYKL